MTMCKCTPEIRTPFCGRGDCVWPGTHKEGERKTEIDHAELRAKTSECEALRGALEKIKEVADQEWPGLQNSVLRFKGVTVSEMCRVALSASEKPTMPATTPAGKEDAPGEELRLLLELERLCRIPFYYKKLPGIFAFEVILGQLDALRGGGKA